MKSAENPMLTIIESIQAKHGTLMTHECIALGRKYAYSIPDQAALELIASFAPIIEIGAGRGYWGSLLEQMDVDIVCTDINPPVETFTNVTKAPACVAGEFPLRTLFICWPYREQPMVKDAAEAFLNAGGKTVIYIADGLQAGDTEGEAFLAQHFPNVEIREKYTYAGVSDRIHIHQRD